MFVFPRKNLIFAYCNTINIYIYKYEQTTTRKQDMGIGKQDAL